MNTETAFALKVYVKARNFGGFHRLEESGPTQDGKSNNKLSNTELET